MKLSPKFGLYEELSTTTTMIQTEEALNKLRWSRIIGRNGNTRSNNGNDNGNGNNNNDNTVIVVIMSN